MLGRALVAVPKRGTANMIGVCPIDRNVLDCLAHYQPALLGPICVAIVIGLAVLLFRTTSK